MSGAGAGRLGDSRIETLKIEPNCEKEPGKLRYKRRHYHPCSEMLTKLSLTRHRIVIPVRRDRPWIFLFV